MARQSFKDDPQAAKITILAIALCGVIGWNSFTFFSGVTTIHPQEAKTQTVTHTAVTGTPQFTRSIKEIVEQEITSRGDSLTSDDVESIVNGTIAALNTTYQMNSTQQTKMYDLLKEELDTIRFNQIDGGTGTSSQGNASSISQEVKNSVSKDIASRFQTIVDDTNRKTSKIENDVQKSAKSNEESIASVRDEADKANARTKSVLDSTIASLTQEFREYKEENDLTVKNEKKDMKDIQEQLNGYSFEVMTEADYRALPSVDENTFYYIVN